MNTRMGTSLRQSAIEAIPMMNRFSLKARQQISQRVSDDLNHMYLFAYENDRRLDLYSITS